MANPLTKQIGPLPAGMWLLVIGGGLFVGYMVNRNMAKPSTEEPSSQQLTETGVGTGGGQLIYDPPKTVEPEDEVDTNAKWGAKAIRYLMALNVDPNVADSAVNKYLTGRARTAQEKAAIALVLPVLGPPPEGVPQEDDVAEGPPAKPPAAIPAVTNLKATPGTRRVTFTWSFSGPPFAGFLVTIKNLKTGKIVVRTYLPVNARSYTYMAPVNWTRTSRSKVQIWITPFAGGWASPNKRYGPGRGASATPII